MNGLMNDERCGERGAALLLVLFVVTLLMVLSAEFVYTTHLEIDVTQNFKEDLEGYYFAIAGFQYALTEVISEYNSTYLGPGGQVGFYRNWYHQPEGTDPNNPQEVETGWPSLPNRQGIRIGEGAFDYIIMDEEGRLNVNYLKTGSGRGSNTRKVFRELLIATGVEEGDEPDIIIDSISDWIDKNDLHGLNGAESDWYEDNYEEMGFSEPYTCKNARLDTLEELLMIRGMTPAILYGSDTVFPSDQDDGPVYAGIAPYITVYGYHRKVNEATAAPLLLRILKPDKADEILDRRKEKKAINNKSKTFRIEINGYKVGSRVSHQVMGVVRRSQRSKSGGGAEVIYWNDDANGFGSSLKAFTEYDSGDRIFELAH